MQFQIDVAGVSCPQCANSVRMICNGLPFIENMQFTEDLKSAIITVNGEFRVDWLRLAIEEMGFRLLEVNEVANGDGGR